MEIIKPNYISTSENVIIYDAFIAYNQQLAIIYNPNYLSEEEFKKIHIYANGVELLCQYKCLYIDEHPESIGIAFYPVNKEIDIEYLGKIKHINCHQYNTQSKGIVASTLFHHTHKYVINSWIDYNLSIGVDHFILYYNNVIDNDLINNLNKYEDKITLVEWNFPYYINNMHNAQVQQLNHCLYAFNFDQAIFIDVDEFIYMNDKFKSIKKFIASYDEYDSVYLECKWTKALTDSFDPKTILKSSVITNQKTTSHEKARGKNIIIHREGVREQLIHRITSHILARPPINDIHFRHYVQLNSNIDRRKYSDELVKINITNPINGSPLIK